MANNSRVDRSSSLRRGRFTRTLFGTDLTNGDEISPTSVRSVVNPLRSHLGLPMFSLQDKLEKEDDQFQSDQQSKLQSCKTAPLFQIPSTNMNEVKTNHSTHVDEISPSTGTGHNANVYPIKSHSYSSLPKSMISLPRKHEIEDDASNQQSKLHTSKPERSDLTNGDKVNPTPTYMQNVNPIPESMQNVSPTPTPIRNVSPIPSSMRNVDPTPTSVRNVNPTPTFGGNFFPTPTSMRNVIPTPTSAQNVNPTPTFGGNFFRTPTSERNVMNPLRTHLNPPMSPLQENLQPENNQSDQQSNQQSVQAIKPFQIPCSDNINKVKSQVKPKKKSGGSGWKFEADCIAGKEYLLMEQIGKGGGGIVCKIKEKESRKDYALKSVNLGALDEKSIQECIHEINMLCELKGSGYVIQIVDWEHNIQNKEIKIVMEIGEIDLHHFISSRKLSLYEVIYLWERMLLIVEFIHSKGIVHSDLKPANFLFVKAMLKLIDFGISNKIQNDATSVGLTNVKGTLNFISPETLSQDAYGKTKTGPKSDIWALGCILHNMVFGFTPFQHIKNDAAKMMSILKGVQEYPPLPDEFKNKPLLLDVLAQCFHVNSRERPTATTLLNHPFLK